MAPGRLAGPSLCPLLPFSVLPAYNKTQKFWCGGAGGDFSASAISPAMQQLNNPTVNYYSYIPREERRMGATRN